MGRMMISRPVSLPIAGVDHDAGHPDQPCSKGTQASMGEAICGSRCQPLVMITYRGFKTNCRRPWVRGGGYTHVLVHIDVVKAGSG
jgi:hypothetical protein